MNHSAFGPRRVLYKDGIYAVQFGGTKETAHAAVLSRHRSEDNSEELKRLILAKLANNLPINITITDGNYVLDI